MKKPFLLLALIILMAPYNMGGIIYRTQITLFISELEQEIPDKNTAALRPFIVIPNRLIDGSEQQDFLRYLLNLKEVFVKMESKELEWEPEYHNEKPIFPRLVQVINIEGNKFEITLVPLSHDVFLGFRIQISKIKSLPEENENVLPALHAVYNATSEGTIFDTEINNFGSIFFIFFPADKKMYILSFSSIPGIKSSIR